MRRTLRVLCDDSRQRMRQHTDIGTALLQLSCRTPLHALSDVIDDVC